MPARANACQPRAILDSASPSSLVRACSDQPRPVGANPDQPDLARKSPRQPRKFRYRLCYFPMLLRRTFRCIFRYYCYLLYGVVNTSPGWLNVLWLFRVALCRALRPTVRPSSPPSNSMFDVIVSVLRETLVVPLLRPGFGIAPAASANARLARYFRARSTRRVIFPEDGTRSMVSHAMMIRSELPRYTYGFIFSPCREDCNVDKITMVRFLVWSIEYGGCYEYVGTSRILLLAGDSVFLRRSLTFDVIVCISFAMFHPSSIFVDFLNVPTSLLMFFDSVLRLPFSPRYVPASFFVVPFLFSRLFPIYARFMLPSVRFLPSSTFPLSLWDSFRVYDSSTFFFRMTFTPASDSLSFWCTDRAFFATRFGWRQV